MDRWYQHSLSVLFVMVMLGLALGSGEKKPGAKSAPSAAETGESAAAAAPEKPSGEDGSAVGESRLSAYRSKAKGPKEFLAAYRDKFWAVLPPGSRDCGNSPLSEPVVWESTSGDAFEREEKNKKAKAEAETLKGRRDEFRNEVIGHLVFFAQDIDVWPETPEKFDKDSEASVSSEEDSPIAVELMEYDFDKQQYTFVLRPDAGTGWTVGTESPKVHTATVSATIGTRRSTGVTVGGKDVQIRGTETLTAKEASNRSRLDVPLKLDKQAGKELAAACKRTGIVFAHGCKGRFRMLQRVTNVSYQKSCNQEINGGLGYLVHAKTLGYEIEVAGRWRVSWYDEEGLSKL